MSKSHFLLAGAVALGLGAVIFLQQVKAGDLQRTLAALRESLTASQVQTEKDRLELEKLREQIAAYQSESEALRKKLASRATTRGSGDSESVAADGTAPEQGGNGERGGFMKGMAKMFTDPEMKKSVKAQQMMGIRMIYGDLFKELGLTGQETEQLADILAERQMEISAAAMSAMGRDGKPGEQSAKQVASATGRYDDQLKGTLGDEKYKTLQTYERTIGDRFAVQQYEGQFAAAGAPLEPAQKQGLLSIMQEERMRTPPSIFDPASKDPGGQMRALRDDTAVNEHIGRQEEMNRRVLDRARQTLSADQIVALEKPQQQGLEMMRAQVKMSRAMFGN